jgi:PAS domain-containing protein
MFRFGHSRRRRGSDLTAGGDPPAELVAELIDDLREACEALRREVDERRRTERARVQLEGRLDALLALCPLGIAMLDRTGRPVEVSERFRDLTGLADEELPGLIAEGGGRLLAAGLRQAVAEALDGRDCRYAGPVRVGGGRAASVECRPLGPDRRKPRGVALFVEALAVAGRGAEAGDGEGDPRPGAPRAAPSSPAACGPAARGGAAPPPGPAPDATPPAQDVSSSAHRVDAAHALASEGRAREALPILIECLGDAEAWVRGSAASGLGRLGPEAAEAVPGLVACLADPDRWVRVYAATALARTGAPAAGEAVPALVAALDVADELVAAAVLSALEGIGPAPAAAAPRLRRLARHANPKVARAACEAMRAAR